MKYNIAAVPGDGIGPEIVASAIEVLKKVGEKFGHEFNIKEYDAGGCAIDKYGIPLPKETTEGCLASDSVLLGAVGGQKWDDIPNHLRPEKALLALRKELGLYTNLRPAKIQPALADACVLRPDIAAKGFDIMIVRELTGGIYFGERGRNEKGDAAFDTESYSAYEIERNARNAFEIARKRKSHVTSVEKSNVLETSRLWKETVHKLHESEYPDVKLDDMYVDNAAMQLVRDPSFFDVMLTSNMFGDILSDEASQVTGSIGLLASASLGDSKRGMYEPIHGSAPDIAGKDLANPIATILSAAMMFRYSFDLAAEADCIENAVNKVLEAGWRTKDIAAQGAENWLRGSEMTQKILAEI
ncbi:MAG: 3-isopropylmalate dehydrogenase [Mogibacterium sp.]|nr:3-isopropylmalate dehydrogenase [Mogibacterium sp.]